jgi:selenocysteine lyase/cysteine desulfurase
MNSPTRSMFAATLPATDPRTLQAQLYQGYAVEAPIMQWEGQTLLRVSIQGYNDEQDVDALLVGLEQVLRNE